MSLIAMERGSLISNKKGVNVFIEEEERDREREREREREMNYDIVIIPLILTLPFKLERKA